MTEDYAGVGSARLFDSIDFAVLFVYAHDIMCENGT